MNHRVHSLVGLHRRRSGMAMLEFLIVLPVLITLLFATIEFGIVLKRWQTISNAAREGARFASLGRETCNSAALEGEILTRVRAYADSAGIDGTTVTVTGFSGLCAVGDISELTVNHAYTFKVLAGFSSMQGFSSLTPVLSLSAHSAMRNERSD